MYSSATPHMSLVVGAVLQSEEHEFHWPFTVYLDDTDAGGIVYHGNYVKYFERARTEMLREKGILLQDLLDKNISFAIRRIELDYIKPAKMDDQLVVKTKMLQLKRATATFCQEIVNHQEVTLCKAMVKVACIDTETMKPIAIPHYIHQEISTSDI